MKRLKTPKVVKVQSSRECKLYESDNSGELNEKKQELKPDRAKTLPKSKSKVLSILASRNDNKNAENNQVSPIKEVKEVAKKPASVARKVESDDDSESSSDFELNLDFSSMSLESLTSFGSNSTKVRRLKSSHCRSVDKLWLPGRTTRKSSFNKNVSRKYSCCPDDNERNFGDYYYTNQNISKWCNHGKSQSKDVNK